MKVDGVQDMLLRSSSCLLRIALLQRRQESELRAKAIRELLASWKKGEEIEDMTEEKAKELEKQAEMLEEYGRRGGWM